MIRLVHSVFRTLRSAAGLPSIEGTNGTLFLVTDVEMDLVFREPTLAITTTENVQVQTISAWMGSGKMEHGASEELRSKASEALY